MHRRHTETQTGWLGASKREEAICISRNHVKHPHIGTLRNITEVGSSVRIGCNSDTRFIKTKRVVTGSRPDLPGFFSAIEETIDSRPCTRGLLMDGDFPRRTIGSTPSDPRQNRDMGARRQRVSKLSSRRGQHVQVSSRRGPVYQQGKTADNNATVRDRQTPPDFGNAAVSRDS